MNHSLINGCRNTFLKVRFLTIIRFFIFFSSSRNFYFFKVTCFFKEVSIWMNFENTNRNFFVCDNT